MESFQWTRQFETGIGDIDEQHLRLVELINAFGDHLTGSADLDLAVAETLLLDVEVQPQRRQGGIPPDSRSSNSRSRRS